MSSRAAATFSTTCGAPSPKGTPSIRKPLEPEAILARLESRLAAASRVGLQRVVNASGLLLHTHLGRASLPQPAVDAIVRAATQPLNLEYDLAQGDRGPREETIADLLMDLTGAEAATVVNNNSRCGAAGAQHAGDRQGRAGPARRPGESGWATQDARPDGQKRRHRERGRYRAAARASPITTPRSASGRRSSSGCTPVMTSPTWLPWRNGAASR